MKQRKIRKRFYEDRSFKEGEKVSRSSKIKEAEDKKTYIILFLNEKPKAPNMKDIKDIIICKVLIKNSVLSFRSNRGCIRVKDI